MLPLEEAIARIEENPEYFWGNFTQHLATTGDVIKSHEEGSESFVVMKRMGEHYSHYGLADTIRIEIFTNYSNHGEYTPYLLVYLFLQEGKVRMLTTRVEKVFSSFSWDAEPCHVSKSKLKWISHVDIPFHRFWRRMGFHKKMRILEKHVPIRFQLEWQNAVQQCLTPASPDNLTEEFDS